ncbi:TRAP transporter small permease [Simplicispira psychrophila]|uniref:TRAP transporter small permease n=1 Tax=Simplicispira psychrophila TaxID=80882 RepID=UPI00055DF39F|nr:TRAP transporter small permease [Simplicispira psychrophila]
MRWLNYFEEWMITFLMAAMTLLTFMQVLSRYVFNYSFGWVLEATGVMFAWLIFIGMAYGVRVGAHIGVDAMIRMLGRKSARVVASMATLLCLAYALIVAYGSFQYVEKMYTIGIEMQDIPIQSWIPRIILPVGFLLLALRFMQVLWRLATGQDARLLGDEAEDALKLKEDVLPEGASK